MRRNGSAIVLCCLAMAVLSIASIAIARSHRLLNIRRSATTARVTGRMQAETLLHREIAWRRNTANVSAPPSDAYLQSIPQYSGAVARVENFDSATKTMDVTVYLYPGAPPALSQQRIDLQK